MLFLESLGAVFSPQGILAPLFSCFLIGLKIDEVELLNSSSRRSRIESLDFSEDSYDKCSFIIEVSQIVPILRQFIFSDLM